MPSEEALLPLPSDVRQPTKLELIKLAIEIVDKAFSTLDDEDSAERRYRAIAQADVVAALVGIEDSDFVKGQLAEPNWGYVSVVASTIIGKIDYKNKDMAGFYFRACAETLGAETSIDILRDSFGPAILKQALAKKRSRPTVVRHQEDRRIYAYIRALMWVTGESMRVACQRLAKLRLRVRKDSSSGRRWAALDNAETIRNRCMRHAASRQVGDSLDTLRLIAEWHDSGEPPVVNWLKALIAHDSAGP
jgi:hypothetical protein